jgi:hypothetical protein
MITPNRQRLLFLFVLSSTIVLTSAFQARSQQNNPSNRSAVGGAGGGTSLSGGTRGAPVPPIPVSQIDGVRELGAGIYRIFDPRPLARVVELIQRKFGVPVSYEEEVLQYSGDVVYAADLPGNRELAARFPKWKGPLVPRMGSVDLSIPTGEYLKKITDPTVYIQEAIDSHEQNNNDGRFKVINLGSYGFSVVMDQMADKSGQIKTVEPVLDTLVSFPEKERTLGETIGLVSRAVAASGKTQFGGGGPGSEDFFERTHVKIGAQNEPARLVIARALRIPGHEQLSWTLSTLPGGISFLTVRQVHIEVSDNVGVISLRSIYWPR